ncbi:MAG: cytochrome c oxidase subunit II [Oscillatoriales cyanobacterium RM2_1_1]|nr:cytochrome c oxidase subunit II [Oscillatoriales cyanobacterium SM2_3_0]NJO45258.1 cytochrome c oxidase subunit II [Oscillatoriales cyanobacterium RM2_1_1]
MKSRTILTLTVVAIALVIVSWWMAQQAPGWLPPQASAESKLIDTLFSVLTGIATFIFLGVAGTVGYSILFHRAGKYDYSDGPPIEGNLTLEIVWTTIPILLVLGLATYSYQIYTQIEIRGPMDHNHSMMAMAEAAPMASSDPETAARETAEDDQSEEIQVLSRQWVWEFRYPGHNVTSTELHLPQNRRIKLTMTSDDVIHGLYIPAFRVKQDIIPGQVNNLEFTPIQVGNYRLRDSNYSGTYFAAMQTNVVVHSPEDYKTWLIEAANKVPTVAYNQAFDEYTQASENPISTGWKTVIPATPPTVNYSGSKENTP